ncbi:hypothetical protein G6F37_010923 [Rhizopus arrhizus]|nr:hypothetical protein G6F38_010650 [Rhizopus arrhizus]KAG1151779.1 hypothetical protein G6F37_010923 [Rhizopus arrhizus]
MDATTLRQLEKSNTRSNPASPVPSFSRSNSSSSIPIASSIPKKPSLKRSSSMAENKKTPSIPSTSNEVKKNFSLQKLSRLSHISNASAPTAPVAYNLNKQLTPIAKRQTKSDFHQRSALESASILQMLKSKDKRQKCSSILKLSEKLHNTVYNPHSTATLPPYVPSKLDLLPILMDYITRRDLESEVYQTLMSWESLAGIFVYVMSVNYYAPTLIIADQQCRNNRDKSNMVNILSKGLKRMKMFLKRNDPELALKLLNLLKSTEDVQKSKLIDYSVKRDIQLFPHYKESLQIGLLEWIEEILCDFIGLPQDEDAETLMEGSRWLNASLQEFTADQWFGEDENMQLTIDYIVYLATSAKQPSLVAALKSIASHLKIANEELYRKTVKSSGKDAAAVLMEYFEDNQSMGTVDLEDVAGELMVQDMDFSIMDKLEEYNENTGMTQEISSLNINPAMHLINNDTNYQDNQVLPTQASPKVLQDKNVVRDNPQTSMTRPPDSPKPTVIRANDENTPIASDSVLMSQNDGGMQPRVKLSRPASNQNISVDDIHLNKKPKHNQENQILAAPVKRKNPTRSNLSANASLRLDTLQTGISKIRSNDVDVALLIGLQQLSAEAPILDIYNIEEDSKFWLSNYAEPFRSLLNELIKLIDTKETIDEPVKVEVIELIRQLINNQKALFMRFSKVIVKGEAHQIVYLVKTLIREDVDMFNKISPIAEDTIIALLSIYSTEVSLRLLWDLIGQYAEANGKEKNRLLFYIDVINKK